MKSFLNNILDGINHTENSIIWMSGSVVDGTAHGSSDIDIYVVGNAEITNPYRLVKEGKKNIFFSKIVDDTRFDLELWEEEKVLQIIDDLEGIDTASSNNLDYFNEDEVNILISAVNHKMLSERLDGINILEKVNVKKLQEYLFTNWLLYAEDALDDLRGMIISSFYIDMVERYKVFIQYAILARLIKEGLYYKNPKNLSKKIGKLENKALSVSLISLYEESVLNFVIDESKAKEMLQLSESLYKNIVTL